ncbi:MAG: type I restriction endonuclease [Candidatus Rokuibacteriota bacterium]
MSPSLSGPELKARAEIDAALSAAGWIVQDREAMNLSAGRGVAVREFKLTTGHGFVDYLLFADGKAVGVLEAKPESHTLSGVEVQAAKYATGLPPGLNPPVEPLPFLYLSTGAITKFTNLLDPDPAEPSYLSRAPAGNTGRVARRRYPRHLGQGGGPLHRRR